MKRSLVKQEEALREKDLKRQQDALKRRDEILAQNRESQARKEKAVRSDAGFLNLSHCVQQPPRAPLTIAEPGYSL